MEIKQTLDNTQDELLKTKQELSLSLRMTEEELNRKCENIDVSIKELKEEVSFLKEPPWTFMCGARFDDGDYLSITSQAITYSTLFYSSTNVDGSGLDIATGIFSAGFPGSYTATWSLEASNEPGEEAVAIFLRKNGVQIEESRQYSIYDITDGGTSGYIGDQGGRTMILHLDRGDTLDLYCQDCSADIYYISFCVSLSQFDVE